MHRTGWTRLGVLTVALVGVLLAAGGLGLAVPGPDASPVAGDERATSTDGAAADGTVADGTDEDIEGETRVVTSEPKWEPAATPPASGNDTVNSANA
ncbi:hypothetical protein ACFO0N_03105 [Halobium salinum]|uniref:Uncharacterized protein n=1 Tax=Halobium salinum TaxID=1364940 RepID=A0ABD5P8D8_9EURY|nr:hypothetical protein [Halobium salinum]